MRLIDQIMLHVKQFPLALQQEVLDFVEYLEEKNLHQANILSDEQWSMLSVKNALKGMENETCIYDVSDLKEKFQ